MSVTGEGAGASRSRPVRRSRHQCRILAAMACWRPMCTGSKPARASWWTLAPRGRCDHHLLAVGHLPRHRKISGAIGSAHPLSAPYQAIQTQDGWINIGAANQANWKRLVEVIGKPELADDKRFLDNAARMQNLPTLIEILTGSFRTRTTSDWLARLEARVSRRTGAVHRRDAQGPAGAGARNGGGSGTQPSRQNEDARTAGKILVNAGRVQRGARSWASTRARY